MAENRENLFFKLLPTILTVVGILIGVWKFNTEMRHRDEDAFRRNIWEKRLQVYEKLGEATANVVNDTSDSLKFNESIAEFNTLYWGVLPMIQDTIVEQKIIVFNSYIRYYKRGENTSDELRQKGYQLMVACKESLFVSWNDLMKK